MLTETTRCEKHASLESVVTYQTRDPRSFKIRFEFESDFQIRDSIRQ